MFKDTGPLGFRIEISGHGSLAARHAMCILVFILCLYALFTSLLRTHHASLWIWKELMMLGQYVGIQITGKGYIPFSWGTASPVVFSTFSYSEDLH